jgi:branched-subunit amino acid aminotransferase/4-amino-4-deoxychorismate lyase
VTVPTGTHEALPDDRNASVEAYIDGSFFPRDEAKVSVFDAGFLVGDGVWEGIRLHRGRFAFLDRHLDRLYTGAATIGLDIGKSREELTEALYRTVRRNEEAFVTETFGDLTPVVRVDGRAIGSNSSRPVMALLTALYRELVHANAGAAA